MPLKAQFMDNWSPMPTHSTSKQEHYQQVGDLSLGYTDERDQLHQTALSVQVHWRGTEDMPGSLQREPDPYFYCQQSAAQLHDRPESRFFNFQLEDTKNTRGNGIKRVSLNHPP